MQEDRYKTVQVELLSDTTFGRGEGTAGVVDVEVEHDEQGLPFLGGKVLHGLLRDSWLTMQESFPDGLANAAISVLGPAADLRDSSILYIGNAVVGDDVRRWVKSAQSRTPSPVSMSTVLNALTDVRHQTSEERSTGAPRDKTLRSGRVVIRGLKLVAPLVWLRPPSALEVQCLALCLLGARHGGLCRNRGRGHIKATINGDVALTRALAAGGSR